MTDHNQKPIGKLIDKFLRSTGMNTKLDELKLIASWEKIVGSPVAKYTKELFIRNRQLFVRLDSAALRHELSLAKESLVKKLNEEAGGTVIENIVFQ